VKIFSLLFIACTAFFLSGCLKGSNSSSCTPVPVANEEPTILAFAANHGINATKDASGLYYQIDSLGTGPAPTASSVVFVTYTGKLLNGAVFDQQTNANQTGWTLGGLIPGWQIGLSLIKKGGGIKLIVPSSLAYGCQPNGPIPANSILYFEIHLVDVQ
jgi:FKBP-type peptidyl-prolyl cis-trans isomerase FkpA